MRGFEWFSQVSDKIFLGGVPSKSTDYRWIQENGISAVLNVTREWEDDEDFFRRNGIEYKSIPVDDLTAPSINQISLGVEFIQTILVRGGKILVHCAKGRGRSATLLCAYMAENSQLTLPQALDKLKKVRPLVSINRKQLSAIEEYLRIKG